MEQDRTHGQAPASAGDPPPALPADAAEALHAFIVPGLGERVAVGWTTGPPQALAVMFADFAARLAALELGHLLSISVDVQPAPPIDLSGPAREAAEVAIVDAAAAVLAPGIEARREIVPGSVHYTLRARTPAGVGLDVYTSVVPSAAEAAFIDAVRRNRRTASDPSLSEDGFTVYAPCQPIRCDNGVHLPGCVYAVSDEAEPIVNDDAAPADDDGAAS